MKKYFYLFAFAALAALFVLGCEDRSDIAGVEPVLDGKSGNADLSRFVVIGNSLAAGYQSAALYESAQIYSFGNLIARQINTKFEMPLVSDPGTGGRMEIESLSGPIIKNNPNTGIPINLTYPAPYNNLGIPGALTYDVFFATNSTNCASAVFANTPNPLFDLILRNQGATQLTQLQQALAQQPTFVILWIGNNDVLGYATSGGVSPSAPTPVGQFTQLYGGISQQLAANPGRQVVVANIPNVTTIPFFTTVGPALATNPLLVWWQISLSQTASGLPATGLIYMSHEGGTNLGILPYKVGFADSASLRNSTTLVTLRGSAYAPLLGQSTGKYYRDFNLTVPLGVDTTKPFGFHPQNPFPDLFVLDPDEINTAATTTASYNAVIQNVATNFNFGLVDVNTLFNIIRQSDAGSGYRVDGITFRTNYVTGGLFSLDGVHPTNQGHAIVANEFIKVINSKYNAKIPAIQVSQIPPSLKFTGKIGEKFGYPQVPPEAFDRLLF
jgi:lysophospholipase L1-like esterase